jgi:hypothetical protein
VGPTIGKTRGKWRVEEDANLTGAVKIFGCDWVAVVAKNSGSNEY